VPARSFVDAGGELFVFRLLAGLGEDEAAVAVAALDDAGLAHLQPDARVAEGAAAAVAGDATRTHDDDLRRGGVWRNGDELCGHRKLALAFGGP